MRVLMTTQPALGHLHPMVPVAQALQRSGHEIAFACAQAFCPTIEALRFRTFPAGLDWLESEAEQTFPELEEMSQEQQGLWFIRELFADMAAHRMVPDLLTICRSWKPDVIVRNDFEFGACVAAERLDIPHATIGIEFFMIVCQWRMVVGTRLARLRSAYSLPPYLAADMFYRYLHLSFIPPSYQFPKTHLAPVVHSLRPLIFDRSGNEELPPWISQLPTRPTVCATMGTIFNRVPEVFRSIIVGLRQEPINLILTVGRDQNTEQFGPQPANVHIERYIPQTLLFPHCDLVIAHGGVNTVMSALSHGLPVLVIPLSAQHPLHARRCADLGVGLVVRRRGQFKVHFDYQPPELSPQAVRDAVQELLQNPSYRQNARRLREEIMSLPGPERAVELLTKLAVERAPQLASEEFLLR